jgi:GNAT superfamily N-acetyltransferase
MEIRIQTLGAGDRPAVTPLLDESLGEGFWHFDAPGEEIAFVAVRNGRRAGAVLCRLERADEPDIALAFAPTDEPRADAVMSDEPPREGPPADLVLHVRAIAVAPEARRAGLARRLLERAEAEAATRGARASYLFAWLPAGRREPPAVPFYLAAGYTAGADLPDFYAAGSVAAGADCPYCGAPPCRCAARPYTKVLAAS